MTTANRSLSPARIQNGQPRPRIRMRWATGLLSSVGKGPHGRLGAWLSTLVLRGQPETVSAAACGLFWANLAGIFIKVSLGFCLAAGYVNFAMVGGNRAIVLGTAESVTANGFFHPMGGSPAEAHAHLQVPLRCGHIGLEKDQRDGRQYDVALRKLDGAGFFLSSFSLFLCRASMVMLLV